ncbi:MAG TPA: PepSY domain-containing protein [Blastocatellia bacterium]|nr:PepSY domain-containing protein [Blastocatellia bacterium]
MRFQVLNRKVHYWAAIAISVPSLIIIVSGLFLQLKKDFSWVQPPERRGAGTEPAISFDQVLEICRNVSSAEVRQWDDINRIDVRPSRGMLKVTAKNNWEIQIDSKTGEVLQVAYRRSDVIESIHDGSWFHDRVKLWVFLPTGATLLTLWVTGIVLFFLPIVVRWRRKRRLSGANAQAVKENAPVSN